MGQPFGPIGNPPGRAFRHFRMISRRHLEAIFAPRPRWAHPAFYSLPARDPALGGKIGISIMTLTVAFVGALLACGGIPR